MQVATGWVTEQRYLKGAVGLGHRGHGVTRRVEMPCGAGMGLGLPMGAL